MMETGYQRFITFEWTQQDLVFGLQRLLVIH